MNQKKRERLKSALKLLSSAANIVESVSDEEQDCLDNCPENLQGTERYDLMEEAVDSLSDAMEKMDEVRELIEAAIR